MDGSTEEYVAAALHDALPGVIAIAAPRRIPQGYSSDSYRIATTIGELVVKIRHQTTDLAKMQSQVEAARLAWAAGVPTTEVLYAGVSAAVGGRPLAILRYALGTDAAAALPEFDGQQRAQFFADFGAAVGQLHQIRLPHFTERIGSPDAAVGDWATVVRRAADRYAVWNAAVGALSQAEIATIRARLTQGAAEVNRAVSPTLTHRDLYLDNVLTNDGRFAAIIDFELAKGYDPLLDFVKLGVFVFERYPESLQPFMTAYRINNDHQMQVETRLAVCFALEQFVQVPNWAQSGAEQLLRDSCQRLHDWLRGSLPWWVQRVGLPLT